jgi:hypothetical protein
VIGYAFAINGEINSADIYVSNALFKKLWTRMLKAAAIEAVAEYNGRRTAYAPAKPDAVRGLIDGADSAPAEERAVTGGARIVTRDSKDNAVYEARDDKSKTVVHRAYVKKQ